MRKWNLPLTYEPKIQPVIDGKIRQTIRIERKFSEGDIVRFYIWLGRPYRSNRRTITDYVPIKELWEIDIRERGIMTYNFEGFAAKFFTWAELDWLALFDGIIPATGDTLREVLIIKNKIPPDGVEGQIIRW